MSWSHFVRLWPAESNVYVYLDVQRNDISPHSSFDCSLKHPQFIGWFLRQHVDCWSVCHHWECTLLGDIRFQSHVHFKPEDEGVLADSMAISFIFSFVAVANLIRMRVRNYMYRNEWIYGKMDGNIDLFSQFWLWISAHGVTAFENPSSNFRRKLFDSVWFE